MTHPGELGTGEGDVVQLVGARARNQGVLGRTQHYVFDVVADGLRPRPLALRNGVHRYLNMKIMRKIEIKKIQTEKFVVS